MHWLRFDRRGAQGTGLGSSGAGRESGETRLLFRIGDRRFRPWLNWNVWRLSGGRCRVGRLYVAGVCATDHRKVFAGRRRYRGVVGIRRTLQRGLLLGGAPYLLGSMIGRSVLDLVLHKEGILTVPVVGLRRRWVLTMLDSASLPMESREVEALPSRTSFDKADSSWVAAPHLRHLPSPSLPKR